MFGEEEFRGDAGQGGECDGQDELEVMLRPET